MASKPVLVHAYDCATGTHEIANVELPPLLIVAIDAVSVHTGTLAAEAACHAIA